MLSQFLFILITFLIMSVESTQVSDGHISHNIKLSGLRNSIHAPVIWLIHGTGGDLKHFDSVSDYLIDKGFRVLRNDMRFHGQSQQVYSTEVIPFALADVLTDMDFVLNHTKTTYYPHRDMKLFLGGLSLGGVLSIMTASDSNKVNAWAHKGIHLKGVIPIASGVPYANVSRAGWEFFIDGTFNVDNIADAKELIIGSALFPDAKEETRRAINLISGLKFLEAMRAIAYLYMQVSPNYVAPFDISTLLIMADSDPLTQEEMTLLHQANRAAGVDSRLVTIINSGHMIPLDQPKNLARQIYQFVRLFC
ncbi:Alpha/Beta hydrolase protein [Pilobolus umbonatus]|nr:Alpha/Beta hydrolase protein [Pilobolus umbonatus]